MHAFESSSTLAVAVPASPYIPGASATPNETHMNRGPRKAWWHTPAIATTVTLAIGAAIFLISISAFGADVSLMLRKLI